MDRYEGTVHVSPDEVTLLVERSTPTSTCTSPSRMSDSLDGVNDEIDAVRALIAKLGRSQRASAR